MVTYPTGLIGMVVVVVVIAEVGAVMIAEAVRSTLLNAKRNK
jgi:hypothetical protein